MKRILLWLLISSVALFGGCMVLGAILLALGVEIDESGSEAGAKSLDPPKELIAMSEFKDNSDWQEQGRVNEGFWYEADEECEAALGKYPEYTVDNYNRIIDEAAASSKKLGIAMPTFSELNNLQSVYTGTLVSSDTWADAFHTNNIVVRMFTKGADSITTQKFGTPNLQDRRVKAWVNGDDGSPERSQYQQYLDNWRMLGTWFYCGTAEIN